jgi:regulator of sirC expression with transglutaminase-like and TPR domain
VSTNRPAREHRAEARRRLTELLNSQESFDIVDAALLVALEEYPELDLAAERGRIDTIAEAAAERVADLANPFARLDGLRGYLFEELGFRGNHEEYEDPRNCYLNEVLDRKVGIPLTLSILLMEVASRAGFEVKGIGLPGHYVSRLTYGGRALLVDAFHGGHVITPEDCRELVIRATGRPSLYRAELLEGASARTTLCRLLLNLKRIYLAREDYPRALAAVERLLLVAPDDPRELRDRGFLQAYLGRPVAAVADLEAYLSLAPSAPDADTVRGRLAWLRRRMSEIN